MGLGGMLLAPSVACTTWQRRLGGHCCCLEGLQGLQGAGTMELNAQWVGEK